jgi:hypothetical protein
MIGQLDAGVHRAETDGKTPNTTNSKREVSGGNNLDRWLNDGPLKIGSQSEPHGV